MPRVAYVAHRLCPGAIVAGWLVGFVSLLAGCSNSADAEPVADAKTVASARLAMTTVQYFGGFTTRIEVTDGKAVIEKSGGMAPPGENNKQRTERDLSPSEREKFAKVIALIEQGKLWEQGDAKQEGVADGGEQIYEFTVGEHTGKFRLINISPPSLQKFQKAAAELQMAIEYPGQPTKR